MGFIGQHNQLESGEINFLRSSNLTVAEGLTNG